MATFYHNRSISFPCRSHPTTLRIQNELAKLKTWEEEEASSSTSAAERICNGLSGLEELYRCVDDLYNLPLTKQALNEKWTHDELLEGSVSLLDICGFARDYMSQMNEHVTDIQLALRRRKGDTTVIETSIAKYTCLRKKMKKDSRKLIATMKKMDSKIDEGTSVVLDISVIRVLKEVNGVSISIFQSLLMLLSVSVLKPKTSKWSMVSKLLHKGAVGCEDQQDNINAFEKVDLALGSLCKNGSIEGDKTKIAQDSLEALEETIEMIENHLEYMFRGLIRTRVSLLNIVSH